MRTLVSIFDVDCVPESPVTLAGRGVWAAQLCSPGVIIMHMAHMAGAAGVVQLACFRLVAVCGWW